MSELKRFVLTKDNRIIDFSRWTTRDTNSKVDRPLNHVERITHIRGAGKNDSTYQDYLNTIKKQSDNVLDLIEVGDLVKRKHKNEIDILDVNEIYLKNLQSNEYNYLKKEIIAIYKPNSNGDYIKVWEKDSE